MKIQFWSVGKAHEGYVQIGVEAFTQRIAHYYPVEWIIIQPPKNAGTLPYELRRKEGETLRGRLTPDDYLIALDEHGKQFSSEGVAALLQSRAGDRTKHLIFLIGGAYGLDDTVIRRANLVWSLSQLVFPHQLVRLILAEQIYRACTITRNEKYHHS